jgi:hypothetical protein
MKQIICIIIYCFFALNFIEAKKLPGFVQQRLDSIKKEVKKSLINYRIWNPNINGYKTLPYYLRDDFFSDDESQLIDSLKLNLSAGMVYDDEMRDRLVQLIRNEYQEWELDSLVNFYIKESIISNKKEAMKICKFDTLQIFKATLDSFYADLKNKNPEDSILRKYEYVEKYKYEYDIFKVLQLDTTTIFKQAYNKIVEREREREREYFLKASYYNIYLVELCGYIGDKRFIEPLTEMLNRAEKDYQKGKIIEALARMREEPYYTDYIKHRTLTTEQIKDEKWLNFKLDDFVFVLRTQEAFLELSKYLLSNKPNSIIIADSEDHTESTIYPASYDAFYLIRDNIENNDLQEMMKGENSVSNPKVLKQVHDWMQKNYGKYKIRRIW